MTRPGSVLELGATFDEIYRGNRWNGVETRSGPGSGDAATARLRQDVRRVVDLVGATSVVDAACGEGYWQPTLPGYIGLDVAPSAIARALELHPERDYRVADVRDGIPRADLVIIRDALQHLSLADGLAVLAAIKRSGSTWLLASTYVGGRNREIASGGYCEPNLEADPYSLPPAAWLIHDGYDYASGATLRDPSKMLGLWRLEDLR